MSRSRKTVSNYLAAFFAAVVLHAILAVVLGDFLNSGKDGAPTMEQKARQDSLVVSFYQPQPRQIHSEATESITQLHESLTAPDPEPIPKEPVIETPAVEPPGATETVEASAQPVVPPTPETAYQSPFVAHQSQPRRPRFLDTETEKPRPLQPIDTEVVYPLGARLRGEEGAVRILVLIDADGRIDGLKISQSSGFAALDRSAERAVRRTRFAPATRRSRPVAGELTITIRFSLES